MNNRISKTPITKRSLFSWLKAAGWPIQLVLVIVIVITVFARIVPLEMQKRIINEAITLSNVELLVVYCMIFVIAVISSSVLKFLITVIQTRIAQKVLSSMRKELYEHILTLPLKYFRKTPPGTLVSALVTEVAPAGELIGMAVAVPLINILTFLAFMGYLLWLNWVLALVAMSVYPVTLIVIPQLQKRSNQANKDRVKTTREMSGIITETLTGIHEVHANGSFALENNKFGALVDRLFRIRIIWNTYKQAAKIVANFNNNFGPFLILLVGGYFTIQGRLDLGGLMAFLAANEKLFDPWKEMMDFYQVYQDASVRYKQTMDFLDESPEFDVLPEGRPLMTLDGSIRAEQLEFTVEGGVQLLKGVNLELAAGEHMALVGFSGSGKSTLAKCLGQMYSPTGGQAFVGDNDIMTLSKLDIARNISVVSQSPYIFNGTIRDNLLYSVNALIQCPTAGDKPASPTLDQEISVLQQCGIFVDVLRFGLSSVLGKAEMDNMAEKLIRVRDSFKSEFANQLEGKVEFFDERTFLMHSTVADNIIFAAVQHQGFDQESLSKDKNFTDFLNNSGTINGLYGLGASLIREAVNLLGADEADEDFFLASPILESELNGARSLEHKLERSGLDELTVEEKQQLLAISLRFIPARHDMYQLPEPTKFMVLEARKEFHKSKQSSHDKKDYLFYNRSEYLQNQSIMANILFGRLTTNDPEIQEKFSELLIQHLILEDLLEGVVDIGMNFQVGSMGDKLSGGQKQKLAIARSFLNPAPVVIMDEATSALDNKSQSRIQQLIEERWKGKNTLISVVHRLDIIKDFDKVAVMKAGEIVEIGKYDELMAAKGSLYQLVQGNR